MAGDARPSVDITAFPPGVLLEGSGCLVPRKIYAKVDMPEGSRDTYDSLRLFVRVRPLEGQGVTDEMFNEQTKGRIRPPMLDDPADNYCMELIQSWKPLRGGRPVPGPGWFEIFDCGRAGGDVLAEAILIRSNGPRQFCSEKRIPVRKCSHPARLARRFPVVDPRGLIALGDLDGDGKPEFVVTAGAQRQTAYRADGTIMWDHDDPGAAGFNTHNTLTSICDLDGDGRNEVIGLRREAAAYILCILDGRTGAVKRSAPAPEVIEPFDNPPICNMQVADFRGLGRPGDILFSHHYSDVTALDGDLKVLWRRDLWGGDGATVQCAPPRGGAEARFPYGFGHTPAVADIDGDGRDEVVAGATLLDHDGRFLWNRKDLPRINGDHNDSVFISDMEGDGTLSILLSSGMYCLNARGEVKWGFGRTVCHGQHIRAARVLPGPGRMQILLMDWRCYTGEHPPHAFYLLDGDGTVLWHRIAGWASFLRWSSGDRSDIAVATDPMPQVNEVLDGEGRFLGYLPRGSHQRAFAEGGNAADTVAIIAQREEKGYMEIYKPEHQPGGTPRPVQTDDTRYSLY